MTLRYRELLKSQTPEAKAIAVRGEPAPITNRLKIKKTFEAKYSENTIRAYKSRMGLVAEEFEFRNWELDVPAPAPQTPLNPDDPFDENRSNELLERILSRLQDLLDRDEGEGGSLSTIKQEHAALKWYFRYRNKHVHTALSGEVFTEFFAGASSLISTYAKKKAGVYSPEQWLVMTRYLRGLTGRTARRNRAMLAVGLGCENRSRELCDYLLKDLSRMRTRDGYNLFVRRSKTDQKGDGRLIPLLRDSDPDLDPIAAIDEWLADLAAEGITPKTHPNSALFPPLRKGNLPTGEYLVVIDGIRELPVISQNAAAVTGVLRTAAVESGAMSLYESELLSSHSPRASGITNSLAAGIPMNEVAAISGHKDLNTMRGYDHTSAEAFAQTAYLRIIPVEQRVKVDPAVRDALIFDEDDDA